MTTAARTPIATHAWLRPSCAYGAGGATLDMRLRSISKWLKAFNGRSAYRALGVVGCATHARAQAAPRRTTVGMVATVGRRVPARAAPGRDDAVLRRRRAPRRRRVARARAGRDGRRRRRRPFSTVPPLGLRRS